MTTEEGEIPLDFICRFSYARCSESTRSVLVEMLTP